MDDARIAVELIQSGALIAGFGFAASLAFYGVRWLLGMWRGK